MSRVCQVTGRKTAFGNNVSHSNRKTRRTFKANVFKKRIYDEKLGRFITMKISAKGLKTLEKQSR